MTLNQYEFYETPECFTRFLFSELRDLDLGVAGALFEPCVGSGAIIVGSPYLKHDPKRPQAQVWDDDPKWRGRWRTNDIDPAWPADTRLDATRGECWFRAGAIDWTITNPPFSIWLDIAKQAIAHSRVGVALHLRASVNEALKNGERRVWMRQNPPTGMIWLPRHAYQPSPTTGAWSTDSVCSLWMVWVRDPNVPQFIRHPTSELLDELHEETPKFRARTEALMRHLAHHRSRSA